MGLAHYQEEEEEEEEEVTCWCGQFIGITVVATVTADRCR
jgi:hypothetical protein